MRLSITDRCVSPAPSTACSHGRDGYLESERRLGVEGWATLVRGGSCTRACGGYRSRAASRWSTRLLLKSCAPWPASPASKTSPSPPTPPCSTPARRAAPRRRAGSHQRLARLARRRAVLPPHARRAPRPGARGARRRAVGRLRRQQAQHRGPRRRERPRAAGDHALRVVDWGHAAVPRAHARGRGARLAARIVPYEEMRARLADLLVDDEPARETDRGLRATYAPATARSGGFITGSSATF